MLIAPLVFVHTDRRSCRLSDPVNHSDRRSAQLLNVARFELPDKGQTTWHGGGGFSALASCVALFWNPAD